jgi:hypothetical protein
MVLIDNKVVADSCGLASPEDHEGRIIDPAFRRAWMLELLDPN